MITSKCLQKSNFFHGFLILCFLTIFIILGVYYFAISNMHITRNHSVSIRSSLGLANILPDSIDWYKIKKASRNVIEAEKTPWLAEIQSSNGMC